MTKAINYFTKNFYIIKVLAHRYGHRGRRIESRSFRLTETNQNYP